MPYTANDFPEGTMIEFVDDPNHWGTVTCLSDDETTVYYKPLGMGVFRSSTPIEPIRPVAYKAQ